MPAARLLPLGVRHRRRRRLREPRAPAHAAGGRGRRRAPPAARRGPAVRPPRRRRAAARGRARRDRAADRPARARAAVPPGAAPRPEPVAAPTPWSRRPSTASWQAAQPTVPADDGARRRGSASSTSTRPPARRPGSASASSRSGRSSSSPPRGSSSATPTARRGLERRLEVAVERRSARSCAAASQPMDAGDGSSSSSARRRRGCARPPRRCAPASPRQGLPASFSSAPFRRTLRPAGTLARRSVGAGAPPSAPAPGDPASAGACRRSGPPPAHGRARHAGKVTAAAWAACRRTILGALLRYRAAASAPCRPTSNTFTGGREPRPAASFSFTTAFKATLVASVDPRATAPRALLRAGRYRRRQRAAAARTRPERARHRPHVPAADVRGRCATSRPSSCSPASGRSRRDTVTLLNSNPRFIEAYMVGLNHELARSCSGASSRRPARDRTSSASGTRAATPRPMASCPAIHEWAPAAAPRRQLRRRRRAARAADPRRAAAPLPGRPHLRRQGQDAERRSARRRSCRSSAAGSIPTSPSSAST